MDFAAENSVPRLRQVATLLEAQVKHLLRVVADKCEQLDKLKGRSGDLQAVLDGLNAVSTEANTGESAPTRAKGRKKKGRRKAQKGHGPTPQPKLERVTQRLELDEADQTCPTCGDRLEPKAGEFETSELVDVVEVKYCIVQVERQKYDCCRCDFSDVAPPADRTVDGGRYSLAFGAKVAVDKYVHHLPLERQVRMMAQQGLKVTSQALWDQVWAQAMMLKPVYDALYVHILAQPVIGLDQTGWPNLNTRKAKKWQMWALTSVDAVHHSIHDDKSAATFEELVGHFEGTIVCDAFSSHGAGVREGPGIQLAGCWAHIRRKFAEAEPNYPEAREMLDLIRQMYDIDARAETEEQLAMLRATESCDVLSQMRTWLGSVSTISSTDIGAAIRHTMRYWDRLTRLADDPRVWLDNNRTERAFRGPVVGRRNHFGSKSRRGTEAAAILYTIIETAKANGLDPAAYLIAAVRLAKLTDGDEHMMPWDFEQ